MTDFSRLSVRGIFDQDNIKNFEIKDKESGEIFMAVRSGQKFELGDFRGTLAECKQKVIDGYSEHFADATEAPEAPEVDGTWACVDPCALLIMMQAGVELSPCEIKRTLDAHGWLTPDGLADIEQAESNLEKWSK